MEVKFELSKGVHEIDAHATADKPRVSWPWKHLDVGDELLIADLSITRQAQNSAHTYAAKTGKKFKTTITDAGIVVWRVK